MLAPSSANRPRPSERRRRISDAPSGVLATSSVLERFSNQRKPGMSSLLPCRIPAWLTGVTGGRSANHGSTREPPSRTRRSSVGMRPARIWFSRTSRPSPSSWIISSPDVGSAGLPKARAASRRTWVP